MMDHEEIKKPWMVRYGHPILMGAALLMVLLVISTYFE